MTIIFPLTLNAQSERKYIRQGNNEYNRGQFEDAEVSYRKANAENNRLPEILFNIGNALYKQEKYDEAARQFTNNITMTEDNSQKAAGLYNLGNSLLKSEKFQESIEAYKESLRLQPNNFEAKHNLAYAQDRLQQQQQDNENNQDNDSQESEDNQNQDNQDQQGEVQNQAQQQQQQEESSISREDAERLLNSLANDEQRVQEYMRRVKASREHRNVVRNW
jgi:tetratricopeptide (TPR) repeat protein